MACFVKKKDCALSFFYVNIVVKKLKWLQVKHEEERGCFMEQKKEMLEKIQVMSGAKLKYIAFLSMLIDHINKALIYPNINGRLLLIISDLFDIMGRIAFPIFMFLLVEGYFKTKNKWKYLGYLIVFGIISEIPFDLFTTGTFYSPNWNNIMFTLALTMVTIWMIDTLKEKKMHKLIYYLLTLVILTVSCYVSSACGLDYDYHAILVGYFFYVFYEKPIYTVLFGYLSIYKEPWALLGFGLNLTYNGERGRQNKLLNYCFYPGHLLILGLLRMYFKI